MPPSLSAAIQNAAGVWSMYPVAVSVNRDGVALPFVSAAMLSLALHNVLVPPDTTPPLPMRVVRLVPGETPFVLPNAGALDGVRTCRVVMQLPMATAEIIELHVPCDVSTDAAGTPLALVLRVSSLWTTLHALFKKPAPRAPVMPCVWTPAAVKEWIAAQMALVSARVARVAPPGSPACASPPPAWQPHLLTGTPPATSLPTSSPSSTVTMCPSRVQSRVQ
jgi:hypothetical protein